MPIRISKQIVISPRHCKALLAVDAAEIKRNNCPGAVSDGLRRYDFQLIAEKGGGVDRRNDFFSLVLQKRDDAKLILLNNSFNKPLGNRRGLRNHIVPNYKDELTFGFLNAYVYFFSRGHLFSEYEKSYMRKAARQCFNIVLGGGTFYGNNFCGFDILEL